MSQDTRTGRACWRRVCDPASREAGTGGHRVEGQPGELSNLDSATKLKKGTGHVAQRKGPGFDPQYCQKRKRRRRRRRREEKRKEKEKNERKRRQEKERYRKEKWGPLCLGEHFLVAV